MSYAIIDLKKKKIFNRIDVNVVCDELEIKVPEFKEKKQIKYAKKVNKILKKYKVNNVVLANGLKKSIDFNNLILQNNNYIITGKKLYKTLLPTVIRDISELLKFEKEKMNIAILVDEYNADNIELIKILADDVKSVTLITNNAYRFQQIVDELLKNKGIVVQLLNNDKPILRKKHVIINIDFSNTAVEKLSFPNESVFITNSLVPQKMRNGFNGIVIREIDIYLNKKIENFRTLELCEAYMYNYMKRLKENENLFNKSTYNINGYIGNKGKIEQEDFERLGKSFMKNKKKTAKNNT